MEHNNDNKKKNVNRKILCNKDEYVYLLLYYMHRLEMQWSMMTQMSMECTIFLLVMQSYPTKQHIISTNFVISHQFPIKLLSAVKQQVKLIRTRCSLIYTTSMVQSALITTSLIVPRRSR